MTVHDGTWSRWWEKALLWLIEVALATFPRSSPFCVVCLWGLPNGSATCFCLCTYKLDGKLPSMDLRLLYRVKIYHFHFFYCKICIALWSSTKVNDVGLRLRPKNSSSTPNLGGKWGRKTPIFLLFFVVELLNCSRMTYALFDIDIASFINNFDIVFGYHPQNNYLMFSFYVNFTNFPNWWSPFILNVDASFWRVWNGRLFIPTAIMIQALLGELEIILSCNFSISQL